MRFHFTNRSLIFLLLLFILLPVCGIWAQEFTLSEKIAARFAGPFHFRFLLQPLMAIILGIRDGKTDAQLNRPPYIFELFTNKIDRKSNLKNALQSIVKPLVIGIVLDAIVQVYLFHSVRVFGAFLVGGLLIGLPYALARGIRNRLTKRELVN
jgi:hypothetical protein